MTSHEPDVIFVLVGVFFFGGLALAILVQALWSRSRKERRGFPVEPPDRDS